MRAIVGQPSARIGEIVRVAPDRDAANGGGATVLTCARRRRSFRWTAAARALDNVYEPNACQPCDRRFSRPHQPLYVIEYPSGFVSRKRRSAVALTSTNTGTLPPLAASASPRDIDRRHQSSRSTCGSMRTRARRAPTSTRLASTAKSVARLAAGDRLRPEGWRQLHRLDGCRRPVSRRTPGRCSTAAPSRCSRSSTLTADRRFLLTNQDEYSLTYNGLVMAVEKRRSHGWQASGSYTLSRAYGLQPSSGGIAAAAQVSTVAPPPVPQGVTFGRDPNDLTNAVGRLPNDRPHMFRAMGSVDIPRTGFVVAANLRYFSGKPWAATALVSLPQNTDSSAFCSNLAARAGCRRSRCSICECRGRSRSALGRVELLARPAECAQRHGGRRVWRRTICSARISVSPPCS